MAPAEVVLVVVALVALVEDGAVAVVVAVCVAVAVGAEGAVVGVVDSRESATTVAITTITIPIISASVGPRIERGFPGFLSFTLF